MELVAIILVIAAVVAAEVLIFAKYVVYLRGNYGYKNDKHRCRKSNKHIYKKNRFRSVP